MKTEHWIIYREERDPSGVKFIAVCHTEAEAKQALEHAAEHEAERYNVGRARNFEQGYQCAAKVKASDFTYTYITAHITQ